MSELAGVASRSDRAPLTAPRGEPARWVAACGWAEPGATRESADLVGTVVLRMGDGRALRFLGERGTALTAADPAGACGVVFDGVIYNRGELRGQLSAEAGPLADDAELMLSAYLRWGEEALKRVKGVFSLVVWDGRRDLVIAARDRMGLNPFFWASAGRELFFSISTEMLIRHPRVSGALNVVTLAESLCNRWHDPQDTYYESVRRVPQGHVMRIPLPGRPGEAQGYRYWNPKPSTENINWIRDQHVERFNEALDQAVSRILALGPAGIFLSGGLDSVSVAAVAAEDARAAGMPAPWALSLIFPDPECNEERVQRDVATELGLPHLLLPFEEAGGSKGPMLEALELSSTFPSPLMSLWQPAYLNLAAEGRQRGCRNILTGGGGDEWLAVSPMLAADMMRVLDVRGLYRLWHTLQRSYTLPVLPLMKNVMWKCGVRPLATGAGASVLRAVAPGVLQARRRRFIADTTPAYVAPEASLRRELDRRADQHLPEPRLERSYYWREGQLALNHALISLELEELFESARRAGVRQFPTYLDADLVDTLMHIPPDVLNRGGRSKGLVRDAMDRRFPHSGFQRQKKVMSLTYYGSLVRRETQKAWDAVGGTPTLVKLGMIDAKTLMPGIQEILASSDMRDKYRVWSLLSLEVWCRARV